MIVDAHCHAGHGDGFTGPWDTDAPLHHYRVRAARAGIQKTILFAAFSSDYQLANREVAAIVRRSRARYLGFAFVHAERDRGRILPMVEECVTRHGFRGIKVHRHDARISREVCEAARRFQLPILYDPAGETEVAHLLADQYPDVNFILPHLGSFADDYRAQKALIDSVARYPNIYTDTAGVRRFDLLAELVQRAGPQKVIFGSDGPWLHPGVELAKVRLLGLSPADEELIVGENVLRLMGML